MPAEICLNIDTEDGLTNGAPCVIKKIDFRVLGSTRCSIIWVEFEDTIVGKKWKNTYRHLYQDKIPISWVPVLETNRRFTFKYFKTYLVNRRQFPLYLSAGKTIHKSQGSTMKQAVLHFGTRKIEHIHYVGISRVTSLAHVHILELNEDKIGVSKEVQTEMERLRKERIVNFTLPNFRYLENNLKTIIFHNCRSLKKHFENFSSEENLLCCDIIGLVETRFWVQNQQKYEIDGFKMLCANTSSAPHGLAVYYKEECNIKSLGMFCEYGIEFGLLHYNDHLLIVFVYCPPCSATLTNLTNFMFSLSQRLSLYFTNNNTRVVIMGDLNIDIYQQAGLDIWPDSLQMKLLTTNPTTDYGSSLDHIYTNMIEEKIVKYGTLESYYSDHKPLYLVFKPTDTDV
jgi:exonuclease III